MSVWERTPGVPARPGGREFRLPRRAPRHQTLAVLWWTGRSVWWTARQSARAAWWGWRWRWELALTAAGAGVGRLLLSSPAAAVAALVLTLLVGVGWLADARVRDGLRGAVGVVWGWLRRRLFRARLGRVWLAACRHARLETFNAGVPRLRRVEAVPSGEVLTVRVRAGQSPLDVEHVADVLAACLRVGEVRVAADAGDARTASVTLVRRDPLAGCVRVGWPHETAARLSAWAPVPVGVDEHGRGVSLSLPYRNVLIGGQPGAGKSVSASMLAATAALDPTCELYLLDGKLVELAVWRHTAAGFVGPDVDAAIDLLGGLQAEIGARNERLLDEGRRKVEPGDGLPLAVLVCDELAFYSQALRRAAREEFLLRGQDVTRRGRSVGVVMVVCTQKPSREVIPTGWRDLFGFRWALRCSTRDASDTILGAGWASKGVSADAVGNAQHGVGWLLAEESSPKRIRSYCLDDDDLSGLADRAARLRGPAPRDGSVVPLAGRLGVR